jgi:hypothetical protein
MTNDHIGTSSSSEAAAAASPLPAIAFTEAEAEAILYALSCVEEEPDQDDELRGHAMLAHDKIVAARQVRDDAARPPACDCGGRGWLVMESSRDGVPSYLEIERCDECGILPDDEAARALPEAQRALAYRILQEGWWPWGAVPGRSGRDDEIVEQQLVANLLMARGVSATVDQAGGRLTALGYPTTVDRITLYVCAANHEGEGWTANLSSSINGVLADTAAVDDMRPLAPAGAHPALVADVLLAIDWPDVVVRSDRLGPRS